MRSVTVVRLVRECGAEYLAHQLRQVSLRGHVHHSTLRALRRRGLVHGRQVRLTVLGSDTLRYARNVLAQQPDREPGR